MVWNTSCITGPVWGEAPATGGFLPKSHSNTKLWYFLCFWSEHKAVEQTADVSMIWDTLPHRWHHALDNKLGSTTECNISKFHLRINLGGKSFYCYAAMNIFTNVNEWRKNARWYWCELFDIYPLWDTVLYDLLWRGFIAIVILIMIIVAKDMGLCEHKWTESMWKNFIQKWQDTWLSLFKTRSVTQILIPALWFYLNFLQWCCYNISITMVNVVNICSEPC